MFLFLILLKYLFSFEIIFFFEKENLFNLIFNIETVPHLI